MGLVSHTGAGPVSSHRDDVQPRRRGSEALAMRDRSLRGSLVRTARTDRLAWISRVLSLVGLMIASYLTYTYLRHQGPVCLTGSEGCVKVEQSRYAHPAGIPMPLFGVAGYLMLLTSAFMQGERARTAGMLLAVLAITVSLWLTYLEVAVIHAICYWCVSSAACAALHVVVNSVRFVRGAPAVGPARGAEGATRAPHPRAFITTHK